MVFQSLNTLFCCFCNNLSRKQSSWVQFPIFNKICSLSHSDKSLVSHAGNQEELHGIQSLNRIGYFPCRLLMAIRKCHSLEEFVIRGPGPQYLFCNTLDIDFLPGSLTSLTVQTIQLKCTATSVLHLRNLRKLHIRAETRTSAEQVGQVGHHIKLSCP